MTDLIELRRHPRVNVDLFADWGWGPACEHYDKITSLSVSGCFLATKRELSSGQEIYLRLSREPGGTITLKGVVRHQIRVTEGAPPIGAGIEFLGVSSESQRKLQALVDVYRAR